MRMPRSHYLRKTLDGLYLGSAVTGAVCLACIGALILAQIVARWFGIIVPAAEEFSGYLMAAATFLALAWTLRTSGHIRVTILIRHFSPRLRVFQEIVVLVIATLLVAYIAWSAVALARESWEFQDVSAGYLAVPLWIPQLPMAFGLVVLTIALLDEMFNVLMGCPPSYSYDNDEIHERLEQGKTQ